MAEFNIEVSSLPEDVREKLAELDLELSEEKNKNRILCLLFVQETANSAESVAGFCLLPSDDKTLPIREILSESGVQIFVDGPATPPLGAKLKVIETQLDADLIRNDLQVHCNSKELQFVSRFFATVSNVRFAPKSHLDSSCTKTVLVDQDLKALDKLEPKLEYGWMGGGLLHLAAARGYEDLCQVLLSCGASTSARAKNGSTALHAAPRSHNVRIVKMLLEHGADVNAENNLRHTPLHEALVCGVNFSLDLFLLLLEKGANVNAKSHNGSTPLCIAASFLEDEHILAIDHLLKAGADINVSDADGETPLHISANVGSIGITRFLIENGARVDAKDRGGGKPLHGAVDSSSLHVVQLLLDYEAKDQKDPSVLIHAIKKTLRKKYGLKCLEYLLEKGFDPNIMIDEETPLVIALNSPDKFRYPKAEFNLTWAVLVKFDVRCNYTDLAHSSEINANNLLLFLSVCSVVTSSGDDIVLGELLNRLWPNASAEVLARHLLKLEAVSEHQTTRSCLYSRAEELFNLGWFKDLCDREVKSLKSKRISGSLSTCYQILVGAPDQVAAFTRNKCMFHYFDSELIIAQFPIYGEILYNKLRVGNIRKELVENCIKSLLSLFKYLPELPDVAVANIVSFMTNKDIVMFTKCKPVDQSYSRMVLGPLKKNFFF